MEEMMDTFLRLYNDIAEKLLDIEAKGTEDEIREALKEHGFCEHCGEPEDKCSGYKCWER